MVSTLKYLMLGLSVAFPLFTFTLYYHLIARVSWNKFAHKLLFVVFVVFALLSVRVFWGFAYLFYDVGLSLELSGGAISVGTSLPRKIPGPFFLWAWFGWIPVLISYFTTRRRYKRPTGMVEQAMPPKSDRAGE